MSALCAAMLMVGVVSADPRVVIIETRDAPALPGLAGQVQLHAGRPVVVSTLSQPEYSSMTFAERAAAIVNEQDASIVVWVAAVDGGDATQRTLLVFAAGRWPGRALIELVRLDASTPAGEVERTVALKIAGLFDTLTTAKPIGAALGVSPVSIARWRIELDGAIVVERGDRNVDGRVAIGIDHRWAIGDWIVAAGIGAYWQPSSTISAEPGFVSIDELGPIAAVAIERQLGSFTLFARPQLHGSVLLAEGRSTTGAEGSATVFSPSAGAQLGLRWHMSDSLELALGAGVEAAFTKQQFLVNGEQAADLRTGRAIVQVGLSVPLR
jgi:hypothetical protein